MHIIRASAMGLCFGVRDALHTARSVQHSSNVTIYGELVHNPLVLVQLQQRGFHMLAESERDRARAQLGNEAFVARAPEQVVEVQRRRLATAEEQIAVLERRLAELHA